MDANDLLKLNQLKAILYCRQLVTLLVVVDELQKSSPDFENESIEHSMDNLKGARVALDKYLTSSHGKTYNFRWN